MAITATPVFHPSVSVVKTTKATFSSLLEKKLEFQCTTTDKVKFSIVVRVEEIFDKFRKAIHDSHPDQFYFQDVHLSGSSLAGIWSEEEASDIDMHALIDLTGVDESRKIADTFYVEWLLLQVVLDSVKPYIPEEHKGKVSRESFVYKKKAALLNSKSRSLPYNTFSLTVGSPPIEFSVWCLCKTPETPSRNYDFNAGSLQLRITGDDEYELSSTYGDVSTTLSELEKKELHCEKPEELTRKGVVRYLSKVLISGYNDLDPTLFKKLLAVGTVIEKGSEVPLNTELLLKQIAKIFDETKEGSATYIVILLHLWFIQYEDEGFIAVKVAAKKELIRLFASGSHPLYNNMYTLVANGKKSELAWLLLISCDTLKKIIYRGEECLQLTLSPAFLSNKGPAKKLYLPLPCRGLMSFKEGIVPQAFILHDSPKVSLGRCSADTMSSLSGIVDALFTSPSQFPILSAMTRKFQLPKNESYPSLFFSWFASLTKEQKNEVSLKIIANALDGFTGDVPLTLEDQLDFLETMYLQLGSAEAMSMWENSFLRTDTILSMTMTISKTPLFSKLDDRHQNILLSIMKAQSYKLFEGIYSPCLLYEKEPARCKKKLAVLFFLYKNNKVGMGMALRATQFCIESGLFDPAIKFLQIFWTSEKDSSQADILPVAKKIATANFSEYVKALSTSKEPQDKKIRKFYIQAAVDSLLEQSHLDTEIAKLLLSEVNSCFSQEEKLAFAGSILLKASEGNAEFELLLPNIFSELCLSVGSFAHFAGMTQKTLLLLAKQKDFFTTLETDAAFASDITKKGIEFEVNPIFMPGLKALAKIAPITCIEYMQVPRFQSAIDRGSLCLCIDLWADILATMTESAKEGIQASLMTQLPWIKAYLDKCSDVLLFKELQAPIQKLHKLAVLFTLESELWPDVWAVTQKLLPNSERMISDWVKLPKEGIDNSHLDLSKKIKPLILSFIFDADAALEWIKRLLSNTEHPTEVVNECINEVMLAFSPSDPKIYKKPDAEAAFIAEQVFARMSVNSHLFDSLTRKKICHCAYFCSVFAGAELRPKILEIVGRFPPTLTFFVPVHDIIICSEQEREIAYLCVLRAWQSRNVEEVMSIARNSFVITWIARGNNKRYIKEICSESTDFIRDIFDGKVILEEKDLDELFTFYFNFLLLQKTRSSKIIEESDWILLNEMIDNVVITCFENIKKKRKFSCLSTFISNMEGVRPLMMPKEKKKLSTLLIESFIECSQADRKMPATVDVYDHIAAIFRFIPLEVVRNSINYEQKTRFLFELIDTYTRYRKLESAGDSFRLYSISVFFQAVATSFTKEEANNFYMQWIKKIATKRKPYSEEESILFSEFMEYHFSANGKSFLVENRALIFSYLRMLITSAGELSSTDKDNLNTFIHQLTVPLYMGIENAKLPRDPLTVMSLEMVDIALLFNQHFSHSHFFVSLATALYTSFFGKTADGKIEVFTGSEKNLCKMLLSIVQKVSPIIDFADDKFVRMSKSLKLIYEAKASSFSAHLSSKDNAYLAEFFSSSYFKTA